MNRLVFSRWFVLALIVLTSMDVSALTGAWRGDLSIGPSKLPIVFNFQHKDGALPGCTLDSPAQGAKGIPAEVTVCTADSVAVECRSIGARFTGRISGDSITGAFSQRGFSFPLVLTAEEPLSKRRPQTPSGPFPYSVKDTVFESADGTRLAGTLVLPADVSAGAVPAVVMVSGSGPQNRDEELFEHRPFAVIADYLGRNGIASFRYDDRGTGLSEGDFVKSDIYNFKDDARGAVDFLRTVPGLGRIGVLGHSEGGTIAFMLGADSVADFVVSLAGVAVTGKEVLMAQNIRSLEKAGITGQDKALSEKLLDSLFDIYIGQYRSGSVRPVDIDSLAKAVAPGVPAAIVASAEASQKVRMPSLDALLALDPAQYMGSVSCPVLALNGDRDTQVNAADNIAAIRRYIPHASTVIEPGLNHLMQHCQTGDVSEYGTIRETIAPEVLDTVATFISSQK